MLKLRKSLLLLCFVTLAFSQMSFAAQRANFAPDFSIEELTQTIEANRFVLKEKAILSGYFSTQSCVWVSENMIVLEHYCSKEAKYPAKSLSVWSKKFGWIQFYEEDLGANLERDIRLNEFADTFATHLPDDMTTLTVAEINSIIDTVYPEYNPACWSTNFDRNTELPQSACYRTEVEEHRMWLEEAQNIVNTPAWSDYWNRIKQQIN